MIAVFFVLVFSVSMIGPFGSVYAVTQEEVNKRANNPTKKDDGDPNKKMKEDYPAGMKPTTSTLPAAADTKPLRPEKDSFDDRKAVVGEALNSKMDTPKIQPRELKEKRTATTSESLNEDGSITQKQFFTPKHFQKEGKWEVIDTGLLEDKNAGDSTNALGRAWGAARSWVAGETTFRVKDNDWEARFAPSDDKKGLLRMGKGNNQVAYIPVGAKKGVAPVVTTNRDGAQTVHYYDLWPGVNVEYRVESAAVKENIILKDKNATNQISFKVQGAELDKRTEKQKVGNHELTNDVHFLKGVMDDEFVVGPMNLTLNNFGPVTDQSAFRQNIQKDEISVTVDRNYLQNLPDNAFPAVVDPTTFKSSFGSRYNWGHLKSFNSDGSMCPWYDCNLFAGSLYEGSNLRYWRGALFAPYDQFKNSSNSLVSASLHLQQRSNESFWTGTPDAHTYFVDHATCLTDFNCHELGGTNWWTSGSVSSVGDIDVTNIYQTMISRGDFGAWLMLSGEDGTTSSFKNFDPGISGNGSDGSYVSFTYGGPPVSPSITSPVENQVFADTLASFTAGKVDNPYGATPLQYEFAVSEGTGPNSYGNIVLSGKSDALQWAVPDGILEDGSTYFIQARTYDSMTDQYSAWGASVPFRIDTRTGKDNTQTYDNLGPIDVNLATGNVATSTSSHASSALGGALGVSLSYNSPLKSRNGLVGKYWKVAQNYSGGIPSSAPNVTRVDRNVDFDWLDHAPMPAVEPDWFYTHWSGYFVAPKTGTYQFGGKNDEKMVIKVNNQQMYNSTGCQTGPCYDSASISLQEGQAVEISTEYMEGANSSYAHMYVKGAVPEKIIPTEWLQTGIRPVNEEHGLTGHYYANYDGSNTFSSNNYMFMKHRDPYLSFWWGQDAPISNGPKDFLVRWTGYITVPEPGTYKFGSRADDGTKIKLTNSDTVVYDDWNTHVTSEGYGAGYYLDANTPTKVTVEYFDAAWHGGFDFKVEKPDGTRQIVPTDWLTPTAQALPESWNVGLDVDGNASYDHARINQNSVVLSDSTGSTHEYVWNGTGYAPPAGEDGRLVRNDDGTFTLHDVDSRTYVFDKDGTLKSLTSPTDDRKPAALKYVYGGTPARITEITDSVDTSRWAKIYYYDDGNNQCGTAPSGYDTSASTLAGFICAVKTDDGRATYIYYKDGQLARVARPGNDMTDFQYEEVMNNSTLIGYRLAAVRDSAANDAIAGGVRTNDDNVKTQIGYDILGRATSVTQPAPTTGGSRTQHTIEYLPGAEGYVDQNGNQIPSYLGITKQHVTGMTEPHGFSRRIKYDALYRTVEATDLTNLTTKAEWHPDKDLLLSTVDAAGMKSTTIYDDEDRPVESYGSAPAAWYGSNRKPLTAYAGQVARSDTKYDEGINGLAVAYMASDALAVNNTLSVGQALSRGQSIWSMDRRFQFIYQTDGNIVVYGPGGALWHAGLTGAASNTLSLQSDGNLVLFNGSSVVWQTQTFGGPSSYLMVQDDGNTVLYYSGGYTWQTGSGGWVPGGMYAPTLTDAPLLHATNIATDGTISKDFGTAHPVANESGFWGMSMTGRMRLPATGNYNFRIHSDGGVRMWIDDKVVINDWKEGGARNHQTYTFTETEASKPHRVRFDYFRAGQSSAGAKFQLYMTPPGGSETAQTATYFSPDYSLPTSTKIFDSTIGDTTTTVNYGNNPELGLPQSASVDPAGLNLTSTTSYEQQGATGSFLRPTTKNRPGNPSNNPAVTYTYYGATETRQNPCDTSKTYKQAGRLKFATGASPDGGTTPGRISETVYDDAGRMVATRTNTEGWACVSFDTRGRTGQTTIPAFGSESGRTVTYNYAVWGDPMISGVEDSTGQIVEGRDLLGRTTYYHDADWNETWTQYDSVGRMSSRTSQLGTETFTYDTYNRMTEQKLDNVIYSKVTYDQYSRVDKVEYPGPGNMRMQPGRDAMNRPNQQAYAMDANLIPNPSLEESTGSPAAPAGWQTNNWGTNTPSYTYMTEGRTGSRSVKTELTSYTNGDAKWMVNGVINVTGSTAYNFSDYYKSNVQSSVNMRYTHQGGSHSYHKLGDLAAASTWTQASYNFTTPSDVTEVVLSHVIEAVGYVQVDDANLHQVGASWTLSDAVTRSQSGRIVSGTENGVSKAYTYDKAGRLTNATIGSNTYAYGFGAQDSSCASGTNANSGKNSNRTSQTINSVTTTYCYDQADRLVSSSDASATNAQYDSHGNTTFIGSGGHPLQLLYDSSDRNRGIEKYTSPGVGTASYYNRDVQGRIIQREATTITNWNWTTDSLQKHGFISSGSSPNFLKNTAGQVTEKYLSLPGGVMATIRPNESQDANKKMYSLSNMHGDVMATTNASGALLGTYAYDPFGNKTSTSLPTNTATGTTFAWVGLHQKITETSLTLTPIQMGARLYFPTLGRFAQVDPIPGGNPNDYIYPPDPINMMDVTGMYSIPLFNNYYNHCMWICSRSLPATIQRAASNPVRTVPARAPASKPASKPAAAAAGPPKNTSHSIGAGVVAASKSVASRVGGAATVAWGGVKNTIYTGGANLIGFDLVSAGSSAMDYAKAGAAIGGGASCAGAAIGISITGAVPLAPAACAAAAGPGATQGAIIMGGLGFIQGGFHLKYEDAFSQ